jgi:hypothetical protein
MKNRILGVLAVLLVFMLALAGCASSGGAKGGGKSGVVPRSGTATFLEMACYPKGGTLGVYDLGGGNSVQFAGTNAAIIINGTPSVLGSITGAPPAPTEFEAAVKEGDIAKLDRLLGQVTPNGGVISLKVTSIYVTNKWMTLADYDKFATSPLGKPIVEKTPALGEARRKAGQPVQIRYTIGTDGSVKLEQVQ